MNSAAQAIRAIFPRLSFLLLLVPLLPGCGDGIDPDRPFILADVSAENLVKQGMEKEIVGDSLLAAPPADARDSVVSADSSKRAWCDGRQLVVQNLSDQQTIVLHEEEVTAGVASCFGPTFSSDGSEIEFFQLIRDGGSDSLYQLARVIIALGEGE